MREDNQANENDSKNDEVIYINTYADDQPEPTIAFIRYEDIRNKMSSREYLSLWKQRIDLDELEDLSDNEVHKHRTDDNPLDDKKFQGKSKLVKKFVLGK